MEPRKPGRTPVADEVVVPCWYAVRTRSNHESVASQRLLGQGLEAFLPAIETPSIRRDRRLTVQRPLFPGYFFVRSTLVGSERIEILRAPGVVSMVGFEAGPVAVPDWQIHSIQLALTSKSPVEVLWKLVPGKRVRVARGAFAGVEGTVVTQADGERRLVISVELLGRSLALRLDRDEIEPIG